jgi:hypothetical protein
VAHAFERQWHLGVGLGIASPSSPYRVGAAASLHAAYGISDVFDARFMLGTSLFDLEDGTGKNTLSQTSLGLAYKIDIIEWVPYAGVRAGAFYFGNAPEAPHVRSGASIGWMAGLDYALSRDIGLGAELSYDMLLPEAGVLSVLARAEYRWGF